jgi:peptidoglycan-N-acetylglucosamine deacetylase
LPKRRVVAAVVAVVVAAGLAYGGWRLWLKSGDLLRPVVVLRGSDAAALAAPPLGARVAAVMGSFAPGGGAAGSPPSGGARSVALTFDDGPYPVVTPLLLQTLGDVHVHATFFLIGRDAEQYPGLTRSIAAAGHEIADHTLTHPDLDALDDAGVLAELRGGTASLERIAADPSERTMFRPPHGRYTLATVRTAQSAGYATILWSDDPGDWRAVPAQTLQDHLLGHATAPEIVLLHSGRPATIAALGPVVRAFRAAGYQFVTVATLLRRVPADEINRPAKIPPLR